MQTNDNDDIESLEILTLDFLNDLKSLNDIFLEFKIKFEKSIEDLNAKSKRLIELSEKQRIDNSFRTNEDILQNEIARLSTKEDENVLENERAKTKISEFIELNELSDDNDEDRHVTCRVLSPPLKIKNAFSEWDYYAEKFGLKKCTVTLQRLITEMNTNESRKQDKLENSKVSEKTTNDNKVNGVEEISKLCLNIKKDIDGSFESYISEKKKRFKTKELQTTIYRSPDLSNICLLKNQNTPVEDLNSDDSDSVILIAADGILSDDQSFFSTEEVTNSEKIDLIDKMNAESFSNNESMNQDISDSSALGNIKRLSMNSEDVSLKRRRVGEVERLIIENYKPFDQIEEDTKNRKRKSRKIEASMESNEKASLEDSHCLALYNASIEGKLEKVIKIIRKGNFNIDKKYEGLTALYAASLKGYVDIVRILLANKAKVNLKLKHGCTAIYAASKLGHHEIVDLLLRNNADVNLKTDNGWTPLYDASQEGHVKVVELLLSNKAEANYKLKDGCTALYAACQEGHLEIVNLLLQNDADANIHLKDGCTPIYAASEAGHREIVEMLLKNKADVDAIQKNNWTALHIATQKGNHDIVDLLLKHGASVNMKTKLNNTTALYIASEAGYLEIVDTLLKNNAEINAKETDGWTPLHIASQEGHKSVVELLLKNNAIVNLKEHDENSTALHIATFNGNHEIVELLLKYKADVNSREKNGNTALHIASQKGNLNMAALLLKYNPNINIKTNDDFSAIDIALKYGFFEIAKILSIKKEKINDK